MRRLALRTAALTAVLPVKPCGAEALVIGSPPGPAFRPGLPMICGCTGLDTPESAIDVGVDRIGFIPLDAEGMAGSIRGIARSACQEMKRIPSVFDRVR